MSARRMGWVGWLTLGAIAASATGCFDPRHATCAVECGSSSACGAGLACVAPGLCAPEGTTCDVPDAPGGDRDALTDGPAGDAGAGEPLVLVEAIALSGPGEDELESVSVSGAIGPFVAGTYGGGPGTFGTTALDTDQPAPDTEAVLASVNSVPLSVIELDAHPMPQPSAIGTSTLRAREIAVDSRTDQIVAAGSNGGGAVEFGAPGGTLDCAGTWVASWELTTGELRWSGCQARDIVVSRVRIHPATGDVAIVGWFTGTFEDTTAMGEDGFVVGLDGAGVITKSFHVEGPADARVVDIVPSGSGWIAVGTDDVAGFGTQAVAWQLPRALGDYARRHDLGGAGTDEATAVTIGLDGLLWVAAALGSPTTVGDVSVDAEVVLYALDPASFEPRHAIELDVAAGDAVFVEAMAASPGGIVFVGAGRGPVSSGGHEAAGAIAQLPLYGRVRLDGAEVDTLVLVPLPGNTGILHDVAAMPDGTYAVGSFGGTLAAPSGALSARGQDGVLVRFTP